MNGRGADGSGLMFDRIARRYDLVNRVISLGQDRSWRRRLVAALRSVGAVEVLDLATGTADVAIAIARDEPGAHVVGVDPSDAMLEVGREKVARVGLTHQVELVPGDARQLRFPDGRFDASCIAFGLRNIPERDLVLREMARVTRRGGLVAILELSEPTMGLMAPIARWHVHRVVPALGAWLSSDSEYRYLSSSIAALPPPQVIGRSMVASGLAAIELTPLCFGCVHLYCGLVDG